MKTVALITMAGVAATASAAPVRPADAGERNLLDASQFSISAVALDSNVDTRGSGTIYSNMDAGPNGYVAFPASGGVLGADDYVSTSATDPTNNLDTFRFVGGVTNAGETMFFEFFDASSNFVTSFGVAFGMGGNFIYTITIGGAIAPAASGILQLVADDTTGSTGQWFLGDAGPTVGSEDVNFLGGNDGQFSHNFELNVVPAPASAALLGLGGLAAARRRR